MLRRDAALLIEQVITGLDVNTTACHMAATTLGLLSPSTAFSQMNIRRMPLGVDSDGDTRVGSLELLAHKRGAPRLDLGVDWASGEHIDTGDKSEIAANSMDLVIMNPPYTRDSLRHDQFSPSIEKKLKAREKVLTAGRAGHGSSAGTMFMDLGEHLTGLGNGATLAVGPLWRWRAPRPLLRYASYWRSGSISSGLLHPTTRLGPTSRRTPQYLRCWWCAVAMVETKNGHQPSS